MEDATWAVAIGTFFVAAATVLLVIVARRQLVQARKEADARSLRESENLKLSHQPHITERGRARVDMHGGLAIELFNVGPGPAIRPKLSAWLVPIDYRGGSAGERIEQIKTIRERGLGDPHYYHSLGAIGASASRELNIAPWTAIPDPPYGDWGAVLLVSFIYEDLFGVERSEEENQFIEKAKFPSDEPSVDVPDRAEPSSPAAANL